jgi:RsiW-degrading membrane proteinase PrsW (M82 family)
VIVLMVFATCYGVMQLAVLGSAARSVRLSTLLLATATGCYACGLVALIGEIGYTRTVAASTGDPLYQVVTRASYTIDPVIEEIAKVIPLIVMAVLIRRFGRQWGLTDFLLVGAAVGAGFAFLEAPAWTATVAIRFLLMRRAAWLALTGPSPKSRPSAP